MENLLVCGMGGCNRLAVYVRGTEKRCEFHKPPDRLKLLEEENQRLRQRVEEAAHFVREVKAHGCNCDGTHGGYESHRQECLVSRATVWLDTEV